MTTTMNDPTKTLIRRREQYRDRWSSYGTQNGIIEISDKLSPEELREFDIFQDYDDEFLEMISPDVSAVRWQKDAILFEQGSYLDLAFFVVQGEVEVFLDDGASALKEPIFETKRTTLRGIRSPSKKEIRASARRAKKRAKEAKKKARDEGSEKDFEEVQLRGTVPEDMKDLLPIRGETSGAAPPSAETAPDAPLPKTRLAMAPARRRPNKDDGTAPAGGSNEIAFLASMDFNLPRGGGAKLGVGEIFGEIGAMSGWPQSVTARTSQDCRLVQIRVPALRKMKRRSDALKQRVDQLYLERALFTQLQSTPLFAGLNDFYLVALKEVVELVSCEPGDVVVREGDLADAIYLVRSGFVKLSQRFGEGEMAVSYLSKGMLLGEIELLVDGIDRWEATATSVEYAELVKVPSDVFWNTVHAQPGMEERIWESATLRIREMGKTRRNPTLGGFVQVALDDGLVQGNSILAIDLEACTRCDDCVRGCAETHDGRARFVREGNKLGGLLIARSCYHCRDPVCLVGCPTGAIHRAGVGAVIDVTDEICIGCGTCANNCPYDAIVMHDTGETWPEDMLPAQLRGRNRRVASKCDLCHDTGHDPACVSNCPQGCAYRVGSLDELQELMNRDDDEPQGTNR